MGTNSLVASEPLVFHLAFGRRADQAVGIQRQPIVHRLPWKEITQLKIVSPSAVEPSAALQAVLSDCPWLSYELGEAQRMEIGFDGGRAGQTLDSRPALPLVVRW